MSPLPLSILQRQITAVCSSSIPELNSRTDCSLQVRLTHSTTQVEGTLTDGSEHGFTLSHDRAYAGECSEALAVCFQKATSLNESELAGAQPIVLILTTNGCRWSLSPRLHGHHYIMVQHHNRAESWRQLRACKDDHQNGCRPGLLCGQVGGSARQTRLPRPFSRKYKHIAPYL